MKSHAPLLRGDYTEIVKYTIFFSKTIGPGLTKLGTMYPGVKAKQIHTNEGSFFFSEIRQCFLCAFLKF